MLKLFCAHSLLHEKLSQILDSAVSDQVIDERIDVYIAACKASNKAIDLYEPFDYLYKILINDLNVFDSNGNPRNLIQVEENMEIALELIEFLGHKSIIKEVKSIKKALPDLLSYFDNIDITVKDCEKLSKNKEALKTLYLA